MNRERILDVANMIENDTLSNVEFDMGNWASEKGCKTAACIAGYTVCAEHGNRYAVLNQWSVANMAAEMLGLTYEERKLLFEPFTLSFQKQSSKYYTKERAVRTLRLFALTGKIDWSDDADKVLVVAHIKDIDRANAT